MKTYNNIHPWRLPLLLLGTHNVLGITVGVCLNAHAHDINNYYNKLIKYNIL